MHRLFIIPPPSPRSSTINFIAAQSSIEIIILGGIKSTYTGSAGSRYASSSVTQSALSPAFSASPMSIDQVPPTR